VFTTSDLVPNLPVITLGNLSEHFTRASVLVAYWSVFRVSRILGGRWFWGPGGQTNFVIVLNWGTFVLSIHVVQRCRAGATFLGRAFKVELFSRLVRDSIWRVEVF